MPTLHSYDNACHLLDYCLARDPHLLRVVQLYVDKFHHKGHKSCSPFMSHAQDPATKYMNSSSMEQGNRYPLPPVPPSPLLFTWCSAAQLLFTGSVFVVRDITQHVWPLAV